MIETNLIVDGNRVSLRSVDSELLDKDYLEGEILFRIEGKQILGGIHRDLVDQLWVYIIDMLDKLTMGQSSVDVYFPDQPLLFKIASINSVQLKFEIGDDCYYVNRVDSIEILLDGASNFFQEMKRIVPSRQNNWDRYLEQIEKIKIRLN